MDFVLRYRGPLPASGTTKNKHSIRKVIHKQLQILCEQEPLLAEAKEETLPEGVLKGRTVQVPRPLEKMYFFVRLDGFRFVPLIHRPHELVCSLDILFLRREKPGCIISHGGDLDNRLKTLFDALRMPHDTSELAGVSPDEQDQRMYCLLEDDSLITRVSVNTQQLLEPLDEDSSTVELLIHVAVQSTYPMYANIGW
jgi:hypothetical protein